ncbi:MAG: biotin--[acetyl-CoA-carboxylase] ligase [Ruminococcaceae bacterium]|nr:biotin--[acetyl-CoA-carboxylase] ligase [Oscillospiraceae bacterium]
MTKRKIRIINLDEIDSTNTYLRALAEKGEAEGLIVTANYQSAGRGRHGKSFFSPADTGLYMSVLLRPALSVEDSLFITPMTAVAVSRAIESVSNVKCGIKWVNDIFIGEKKVSGILCEASFNHTENKVNYIVAGIGININKPKEGFPTELGDIAAFLGNDDIKEKLLHKIIEELFSIYNTLPSHSFFDEYKARSVILGREVEVLGSEPFQGTVLDIDESCHLVIKKNDGEIKKLSSGEISIKIAKKQI